MKYGIVLAGLVALGLAAVAHGQVSVDLSNGNVAVKLGKGNVAGSTAGTVEEDVDMTGVAVINGDVFVDGEKVPRGKKVVKSKKTGTVYHIQWGRDGNVSVTSQGE